MGRSVPAFKAAEIGNIGRIDDRHSPMSGPQLRIVRDAMESLKFQA
jgi:hypothetical protein